MSLCLTFVELLLLLLPCHASVSTIVSAGFASGNSGGSPAQIAECRRYPLGEPSGTVCREYNLFMEIRGREVTGICIINIQPDSTIVGTVVNEFGVKVFDFTYDGSKAKVFNVIRPLDKWYIRKVLRNDFRFILSNMQSGIANPQQRDVVEKKRKLTVSPNGNMVVENTRFKVRYTFEKLRE